jgi:eukaryotic-like serine/threonine-protein kinase
MVRELQSDDPQFVGPYRLRALLGAGGMGRVYLGLSAAGQPVAVKVIRADLAADPEFRARFHREVAVARMVSNQFTAPVIDADLDAPVPWLATAYVDGPSLDNTVAEHGPLPVQAVLRLAAGLAEGLSAIHAAGVVHRDLKPSNVLLAKDGPQVIDFGISRATEGTALTRTGLVIGSPGFMSPEQAEGRQVGPASDVFSLGAVLAFAASGEGPFGSGSTPALVYRVVFQPPSLDRVPAEVRTLVERCLAKDPSARPTARDLVAELNPAAAVGAVRSAADPLPDPATRTIAQQPAPPGASRAVAFANPPGISGPGPGRDERREDRRHRRRLARPLAIASIVAAVVAASAAGAFALTGGSTHQTTVTHPGHGMSVRMTSSAPSAPRQSAAAQTSPSAAPSTATAPTTYAAATPSASATPTTATSSTATTSPTASPSTMPSSSPSPAASSTTGATSPASSGTTAAGSSAPSTSPTPTSP